MNSHGTNSVSGGDAAHSYGEVAALRQRAQSLRNLAAQILTSPVMDLLGLADQQTWNSPRAEACKSHLSAQIVAARQAADELAQIARRFEEQALELEYAIAQQVAALGTTAISPVPISPVPISPARKELQ